MMRGVRAGDYDAIVAVHPERLHRNVREQLDFIDDMRAARIPIQTVRAGLYDVTTTTGRMAAIQVGAVSQYYAENLRDLVVRAMTRNAEAGRPHGRIAYGWKRVDKRDIIDPDQAEVVRDLAERVIRGESISAIVRDLIERGVPAPTAKPWTRSTVRALLTRAERNTGQRVHRGEVVGDGAWPAILGQGTQSQVLAILKDETRRTAQGSKAVHLLSGIARCDVCDAALWVGKTGAGTPVYRCQSGHVGRPVVKVDRHVTDALIVRLSRPDAVELFAPDRADDVRKAQAEAKALQEQLDEAYATLSVRGAAVMEKRILPLLEAAQARTRMVDDRPVLADLLDAEDVRAAWDGMSLSRRRAVIDLLVMVRLRPGRKGSPVFDPHTVDITWPHLNPARR